MTGLTVTREDYHPMRAAAESPCHREVLRVARHPHFADEAPAAVETAAEHEWYAVMKAALGDAECRSTAFAASMVRRRAADASQAAFARSGRRILHPSARLREILERADLASASLAGFALPVGTTYVAFGLGAGLGAFGSDLANEIDGVYVTRDADGWHDFAPTGRLLGGPRSWPYRIDPCHPVPSLSPDDAREPLGATLRSAQEDNLGEAERVLSTPGSSERIRAVFGAMVEAERVALAAEPAATRAVLLAVAAVSAWHAGGLEAETVWPREAPEALAAAAAKGGRPGEKAARTLSGRGFSGVRLVDAPHGWTYAPKEPPPKAFAADMSFASRWHRTAAAIAEGRLAMVTPQGLGTFDEIEGFDKASFDASADLFFADAPVFVISADVQRMAGTLDAFSSVQDMATCGALAMPFDRFVVEMPPEPGDFLRLHVALKRGPGKDAATWTGMAIESLLQPGDDVAVAPPCMIEVNVRDPNDGGAMTTTSFIPGYRAKVAEGELKSGDDRQANIVATAFAAAALMADTVGIEKRTVATDAGLAARRAAKGKTAIPDHVLVRIGRFERRDGRSQAVGEGATVEVHLRRGHKRRVAVGEGRAGREWRYIPGCVVGYLPDGRKPEMAEFLASKARKAYLVKA